MRVTGGKILGALWFCCADCLSELTCPRPWTGLRLSRAAVQSQNMSRVEGIDQGLGPRLYDTASGLRIEGPGHGSPCRFFSRPRHCSPEPEGQSSAASCRAALNF